MFMLRKRVALPGAAQALPGRPDPIPMTARHYVFDRALKGLGRGPGTAPSDPQTLAGEREALTFVLDGLSKRCASPKNTAF